MNVKVTQGHSGIMIERYWGSCVREINNENDYKVRDVGKREEGRMVLKYVVNLTEWGYLLVGVFVLKNEDL